MLLLLLIPVFAGIFFGTSTIRRSFQLMVTAILFVGWMGALMSGLWIHHLPSGLREAARMEARWSVWILPAFLLGWCGGFIIKCARESPGGY